MRLSRLITCVGWVAPLVLCAPILAQESPFLPERVYGVLVNEISGDIAFEHIRWQTHYHRPTGGSPGFEAVARYIEAKAKEYGLEGVRYIPLANSEEPAWNATVGELWLTEPEERRLAFSTEVPLSLADNSRSTDIQSAPLVDVGAGATAADYAGVQVHGAVVLASGPVARVMDEACWKRGALGIVHFDPARRPAYPDQYPWTMIPVENADKTKTGTFAFVLRPTDGQRLRREMAQAKGSTFRVRAKIVSEFREPSSQALVEAFIRGTEIQDQDIVLTAHMQEEMFSANDDASGSANVLEIGRALKKAIDEGRLPRPRRNIRFWWTNENGSERQYFMDHPEERRHLLADINQDMVGAKQSIDSRVQFITRPPFARASFLGDVIESIVDSLVKGNTAFYAVQGVPGRKDPFVGDLADASYSRPILSRLGTRERYDARVIRFHNSSDHAMFNNAAVRVPAVTFTNWPDEFIHSSGDDLWQIDPTQLKRNAVAVAAAAYYLATTSDAQVPTLAATMYGAAVKRIAEDSATAMRLIVQAPEPARSDAYARSVNLVRQAVRRERRALESVSVFVVRDGEGERTLDWALRQLPSEADATARIAAFYTAQTGKAPNEPAPNERERSLSEKVPTVTDSLPTYFYGYLHIRRPAGLHGLMAWEALNFVDGHASYVDIFKAVTAEADSAGDWYYGKVTLEDVAAYLDDAEKLGMITTRMVSPGTTPSGQ